MDPIRIIPGFTVWAIVTNADKVGMNVRIILQRSDKTVRKVVYVGR